MSEHTARRRQTDIDNAALRYRVDNAQAAVNLAIEDAQHLAASPAFIAHLQEAIRALRNARKEVS